MGSMMSRSWVGSRGGESAEFGRDFENLLMDVVDVMAPGTISIYQAV
jgi:hypothetical protein